jgi:hypothetical protein
MIKSTHEYDHSKKINKHKKNKIEKILDHFTDFSFNSPQINKKPLDKKVTLKHLV